MNKFKKILVGALVAASASALAGAVACKSSSGGAAPNYYELKFEGGKNFDYVYTGSLAEPDAKGDPFLNGASVKEGLEITFKIVLGDSATGTPEVKANGITLLPDDNDEYRFVISENTVVKTENVGSRYKLSMSKFERILGSNSQYYDQELWIKYYDEDGKDITGKDVYVESDSEGFKFKLWVSPYYKKSFTVSVGSEVLDPDQDGYYTVSGLNAEASVQVNNLVLEDPYPNRAGCGDGTINNPYLISKPVDLYYLAVLTNDDGNYGDRFSTAYYRLENDIDMEGEQLFVIGDNSAQNAVAAFMGSFDGNGHKIHNFTMTDEVINQETFEKQYLPYVGLFGVAMANGTRPAVIKNLTIENFSVTAHPGTAGQQSVVGGLVGYGIGVEITNCHVAKGTKSDGKEGKADILATGDNKQLVYMGGMVGRLQGGYRLSASGTLVTFDSFVRGSSADVSLDGIGTPYTAGGIVGYLVSANTNSIAYVINSYSKGQISGGMYAGGIVGVADGYTSVTNCYSTADVTAQNNIVSSTANAQFLIAYAGGIAGYAAECSAITGCYAGNSDLLFANSKQGTARTGGIVAGYATVDANSGADLTDAIIFNNLTAGLVTPATFTESLGWPEYDWEFDGDLPTPISGAANEYSIIVKDTHDENFVRIYENTTKGAIPIYKWYDGNKLPEYHENDNGDGRSWGYYFDEELTLRVPYGYTPAAKKTLFYVGFADYSEVAGVYNLRPTEYADSAYVELTADGRALYRNGGLYHECDYAYDGENVIIYGSALATLQFSTVQVNGGYHAFGGKVENGVLNLKGVLNLYDPSGSEEQGTQYVSETLNLTAVKQVEGFNYGEYVDTDGARYIFNKNGTGKRILTSGTLDFTYSVVKSGSEYTVQTSLANTPVTVVGGKIDTIADKSVSLKDGFVGSWKTSANSSVSFTFDGVDQVTYTDGGTSVTVSYEVRSGVAEFTVNEAEYEASFSGGTLVINGQNYYVNDGFTGSWFITDSTDQIDVVLEGVGANGYGYATLTYTGRITTVFDAQYDVFEADGVSVLRIYVGDMLYAELEYDALTNHAVGAVYSRLTNSYKSNTAYLYDALKGVWVSGIEDTVCGLDGIDTISFNGRSADANAAEVVLRSADGRMQRGTYALTGANSGTLTAGGDTLAIKYDEKTNSVTLTIDAANEETVTRRDGWYNVVLFDGATSYTFDGKSSVGGKVKVNDGTTESTLTYTLVNGQVTMGGYALTPTASGFTWNGKTLAFDDGFVHDWLVSGEDGLLTISAIDGWFKANVSYGGGSAVQFTYNPESEALELIGDEGGERVVSRIRLMGTRELQIVHSVGNTTKYYNCIINGDEDKWKGVYGAEDGSSWKFDGLGDCGYGSGTAIFTPAVGEAVRYSYMNNELGLPYISDIATVFIPAESGESGYTGGGKTYKAVAVDAYYGRTVSVLGQGVRKDYFFDGAAKLWLMNGGGEPVAEYSYDVVSTYRTELTLLSTGVKYNARISDGVLPVMTITEQLLVTEGEGDTAKSYSFGISGVLWRVEGNGYVKAYEYVTIDSAKGEYRLTDEDEKVYDAVVKDGKITITEQTAEANG